MTSTDASADKVCKTDGHFEVTFERMHEALLVVSQMTVDLAGQRGAIAALPVETAFVHLSGAVDRWIGLQIREEDPSSRDRVLGQISALIGTASTERDRAYGHGAHGLRSAWDLLITHCAALERHLQEPPIIVRETQQRSGRTPRATS